MRTLKDVLARNEERSNLRNMGLCFLMVLALIVAVFSTMYMRSAFDDSRGLQKKEVVIAEDTG